MNLLLGKIWGYLVAAGAVIAAGLGIYFKGRNEGKDDEQAKQTKDNLDAEQKRNERAKSANEIADEINRTADADVDKQLRDKYSRD